MTGSSHHRAAAALAALALAAGAQACVSDERREPPPAPVQPARSVRSQLVIENRTSHAITEIRIAAVADRNWDPNLLETSLPTGARVLTEMPLCAHYDVLVVKEDGARCVLPNTALCFGDDPWTICDVTLESCVWQP